MTDRRLAAAVSLTLIFSGQSLVAQAPFQHREYSLLCSGAPADAVNPPSVIHAVTWDVPHTGSGGTLVDSVHEVLFTFYNDELYQMIITYDRGRTAGLTNDDVVETFSATYGVPLVRNARTARNGLSADIGPGMTLVAQWEDARWLLTLRRSTYSAQYQFVLVSKALNPHARPAITEPRLPDALDVPECELDRRAQAMVAAAVADESLVS
jgi:hypothetical protein